MPRLRLVQALNEGLKAQRKLTLVSAPAGFGKTTLVVAWLKQIDLPAAWLSLDDADNDLPPAADRRNPKTEMGVRRC